MIEQNKKFWSRSRVWLSVFFVVLIFLGGVHTAKAQVPAQETTSERMFRINEEAKRKAIADEKAQNLKDLEKFKAANCSTFSVKCIANGFIAAITELLVTVAKVGVALTIAELRIFMEIASYNHYIYSPVVQVGWLMVRDIANMFFVVALLVIAFGTILGLENYEWKKSLVKLILFAILINFSRLLIGLLIDASHIFTITFLNAVEGTAGGNLINMLHLDGILSMTSNPKITGEDLRLDLLAGGIMAVLFSLIAVVAVGAYLVMMAIRVVVLWILIIVSPLAFIFSTLPQTKQYASEFWGELTKYLIVAPVMVFFLWLAFATLGDGDINNEVGVHDGGAGFAEATSLANEATNNGSVSILQISTWENMSAFIIAIAFLMIGLERTQKIGTIGSSFAGSALEFGKKAITYGSGFVAAKFLAKKAAYHAPMIGGKAWERRGKTIAGIASGLKGKLDIGRDTLGEKLRDKERKGLKGSALRGLAKVTDAFGISESSTRKDKKAENWHDWGENMKKRHEAEISTSKTLGGQMKLKSTIQLEIAEEKKNVKKQDKFATMREKLIGNPGKFQQMYRDSAKARAAGEATMKKIERQKKVDTAIERAKVLRGQGKVAEAAALLKSTYAGMFKEDQQEFEGLNHTERVNQAGSIAQKMKILNNKGGARTDVENNELKNLRQSALKLIEMGARDSEEQLTDIVNVMTKEIYNGNSQSLTHNNMGQRLLEVATGKQIGNFNDFNEAHKLIDTGTFRDADESQAALASTFTALRSQVQSGGIRAVDAVRATKSYDNTKVGRSVANGSETGYRFAIPNSLAAGAPNPAAVAELRKDETEKTGSENYFAPRVSLPKARNLYGFMNTKLNPAGKEMVETIDTSQADQLAMVLSQFADERAVSTGFSSTTAKANERSNFTGIAQQEMIKVLKKVKANYDGNDKSKLVFNTLLNTKFKDWDSFVTPFVI